jgi:hypothetical protein
MFESPLLESNTENRDRVSDEVETRRLKDLEEKRQMLTNRVYEIMQHGLTSEVDPLIWNKYERIVYDDIEKIESIFASTQDFYEAAELYEDHAKKIAQKWELAEDFNLKSGEYAADDKDKFFHSLECQKNMSRARILKIEAEGHEFESLLALDGMQFLKDREISDLDERAKTNLTVTSELFASKMYGMLAKLETKASIKKQNLRDSLAAVWKADKKTTHSVSESK